MTPLSFFWGRFPGPILRIDAQNSLLRSLSEVIGSVWSVVSGFFSCKKESAVSAEVEPQVERGQSSTASVVNPLKERPIIVWDDDEIGSVAAVPESEWISQFVEKTWAPETLYPKEYSPGTFARWRDVELALQLPHAPEAPANLVKGLKSLGHGKETLDLFKRRAEKRKECLSKLSQQNRDVTLTRDTVQMIRQWLHRSLIFRPDAGPETLSAFEIEAGLEHATKEVKLAENALDLCKK